MKDKTFIVLRHISPRRLRNAGIWDGREIPERDKVTHREEGLMMPFFAYSNYLQLILLLLFFSNFENKWVLNPRPGQPGR